MTVTVASNKNLAAYEAATASASIATTTGSKSLTIETGKGFIANDTVQLVCNSGQRLSTIMTGTVTSYDAGTGALVVNATGWGYPYAGIYASKLIGTGAWTTVTDPGLNLASSDPIKIIRIGGITNFMVGTVTSYNNTTGDLVVNIASTGGSGTYSDWVMVSSGTFATWNVTPVHGDTIDVTGTAELAITQSPTFMPAVIRALDRGKINIENASTVTPLVLTFYGMGNEALRAEKNAEININLNSTCITLATGNGSAGQSFALPAAIDWPGIIEVESGNGTGVFRPWHLVSSGSIGQKGHVYRYTDANFGTTSVGSVSLGNVLLVDVEAGTITTKNAIPSGAIIRIPNVHFTAYQWRTYLNADIAVGATTATVNLVGLLNTTGEAQLSTERCTWSARSNNSLTIARAARGTTASAWTKGTQVRVMNLLGTSGNHLMPRLDVNPSGTITCKGLSCGFFYFRVENHAAADLRHLGAVNCDILNSSAGAYLRTCYSGYNPTIGYVGKFAFSALSGEIDIDGMVSTTDSSQTNQNNTATSFTNCFGIKKADGIESFIGKRNGTGTSNVCVLFQQSAMSVPGTRINGLVAVGGRIGATNCNGLRFESPLHGDQTNGTDSSTAAMDAVYFSNCASCLVVKPGKLGAAARNAFISTDAPCLDIFVYSPTYDLNNNGYPATPNGTGVRVYNGSFGNSRSNYDGLGAATYTTGKALEMRNVRMSSPTAYATDRGNGYVSYGQDMDVVTGPSMCWLSAGGMVPNYLDLGPMFTLIDDAAGTTGCICVGSFAGEASRDMYDLTGAYLDNAGRLYMEAAGNVAVIKSTEPIRSVTSFQNAAPLFEIAAGNFTVGAAGSGYTSGNEYSVTGGSGTGGKIRMGATTLTTAAVFSAGSGYQVGDVLSVASGGGQFTLTWMPTLEFRIANPGAIDAASWQAMNGTTLAAAISGLAGYDSNVGFDLQVRLTQVGTVVGAYIANLRLLTNNDGAYQFRESWFTLTGVDATDTVELRKSSDNSLLTTWTGPGQQRFVGAPLIDVQAYFIRKTSGAVVLRTTIATPVTLDVANNGSAALDAARITITGLSGHAVYLEDNTGTQVDFQASVTGDYTFQIPAAATGTWKWAVKRPGYKHATGSFTPTAGVTTSVAPTMPQKLRADGVVMYAATSDPLCAVTIGLGSAYSYIDIGNGTVSLQAVFDESEVALCTAAGLAWLAYGRDDLAIFPTTSISYLFQSDRWRLRRAASGDLAAAVTAYVISTDGVPQDVSNGTVFLFTSTTATDVAAAVRLALASELAAITALDLRLPSDPADQSLVDAAIAAIPAAPSATDNADAVLAAAYEGTETVRDHLRLSRSVLMGKDRGTATAPAFESADGSKVRVGGLIVDGVRSNVTVIDPA